MGEAISLWKPPILWLMAALCSLSLAAEPPALSAPTPVGGTPLLHSYLPPAMQVLAHFTNQLKYDIVISSTAAPTTTTAPPSSSTTTTSAPTDPSTTTTEPTTTEKIVASSSSSAPELSDPEHPASPTTVAPEQTTAHHLPGIFAPVTPPRPQQLKQEKVEPEIVPPIIDAQLGDLPETFLPGIQHNPQRIPVIRSPYPHGDPFYIRHPVQEHNFPVLNSHTYFQPKLDSDALLLPAHFSAPGHEAMHYPQWFIKARSGAEDEASEINEDVPDISALPVENEGNFKLNLLELQSGELSDENLQYLSPNVREILQSVHGLKNDDKSNPASSFSSINDLYDTVDRKDAGGTLNIKKKAVTQSMIQMLLLYDLLSRDAKKQKLNNYRGYTEDMVKDLTETSGASPAEQLRSVLERMVARGDCTHDFTNNRAKDMIKELEKADSKLSMEIRYLQPLHYVE